MHDSETPANPLVRFFKDNGLSLSFLGLYLLCGIGQSLTGVRSFNDDRLQHHLPGVNLRHFLTTGTFLDGVFVNWQAALLQLFVLVLFGSLLFQRGGTHSRKQEDEAGHQDEDKKPHPPRSWIFRHSLSLAFLVLFLLSFALHVVYGAVANNEERLLTRDAPQAIGTFFASAKFWSSTLSCWQAEFFAIFAYVILSIFLRQQNSPESKPEDSSDKETGESNK